MRAALEDAATGGGCGGGDGVQAAACVGLAVTAQAMLDRGWTVPVVAVDLPSGWDADSMERDALIGAFRADAVVTFVAPKMAHVFGHLTRRKDFWPGCGRGDWIAGERRCSRRRG